jgi:hypothetical protein
MAVSSTSGVLYLKNLIVLKKILFSKRERAGV